MKSKIVLRNSALNALDMGVSLLVAFATAGIVARSLGPAKMGRYAFAMWLAGAMGGFAMHGVGAILSKYLSESFGKGDWAMAKALARAGYQVQTAFLMFLSVICAIYVYWRIPPGERLFTTLVLATMLPGLLSIPPTMVNMAAEDFRANVIPALVSTICQPLGIVLALGWTWGPHVIVKRYELTGLAAGFLFCKLVDLVLRLWMSRGRFPKDTLRVAVPAELKSRMWTFFWHSSALLLLDLIVWERSEVFFLKELSDKIQLGFYYTGFSISGALMALPSAFAGAASASLMVERGRNPAMLNRAAAASIRYMAMMVFPMAAGLAAVAGPLVRILYGPKYIPAIPVFALMALLVIPKALVGPAQWVLRAVEKQAFMVKWMIVSSIVTVAVDYVLIGRYGAMGAAWGNGIGQFTAVAGIWFYAQYDEGLPIPWSEMARMAGAASIMGVIAYSVTLLLPTIPAIIIAVPIGVVAYLALLRALRSFADEDGPRLRGLGSQLPGPLRAWYLGGMSWILD